MTSTAPPHRHLPDLHAGQGTFHGAQCAAEGRGLRRLAGVAVAASWWTLCGTAAVAQPSPAAPTGSIYSCVDAHGRRLTSDRPILSCIDREQRELNRSGGTRRVIPPTLSATEREARARQEREAELAQQRARDAISRDQALVTRYPDKAAHEASRTQALAQTQAVDQAAEQRLAELAAERKVLDDEMEFYRKDPSRAPVKVRRSIEYNAQNVAEQRRAIAAQQAERDRINAQFDEEARRLQALWQGRQPAPQATSAKR